MTRSEIYLYNVLGCLMKRHTADEAYRILDPLQWYISTGRAPGSFLRLLYESDPDAIASVLEQEGTVEESIVRVKNAIKYPGYAV